MYILEFFLHAIFYGLGAYLLLNCLYLLFFSLAGHKKLEPLKEADTRKRKMCVLIPAYKEDTVILETSKEALHHPYGGEAEVIVIADGLKPETVQTIRGYGVRVIEVQFEKSTKGKALAWALDALGIQEGYEVAVVLDVDNIMGAGFLEEVNKAFGAGYQVVQAHRTAKNLNSSFAFLDACNEEINNHLFRKSQFAVGLSSALIGSGMAFDYGYLKKLLVDIGDTVGEDKELDFRIARDQVKIAFLNQVYVYDEKVENPQAFTQQRTRWIAAQVQFMKKYAWEGVDQLIRFGNIEFFNKVVQAFLVPRMLLMGVLGVFFLQSFFNPYGPPLFFWFCLGLMLVAALLFSLPKHLYRDRRLAEALLRLPYAVFCMGKALFQIKKAKASFLPTPHKSQAFTPPVKS
jgi:cellulose synthase/poly-beta-1,6-N-acetylglucosamine synthase-like glycosyltransferase